jgi:hypothetical protein
MNARGFLNQRRSLNLAAALAFGSVSSTSICAVNAADEVVAATESAEATETAMGALLLQAGETALQKKNVKVARKDLIKARKLLHTEKNLPLEARALTLLSQLEAAATNRRLSASYAAQAKALEEELGIGTAEPQENHPGSGLANAAVDSTHVAAADPTDAGQPDAQGNQGNVDAGRPMGNSDALQKFTANSDADPDALVAVDQVSPNLDASGTADIVPVVAEEPLQDVTNVPSVPTAIAILFGVWGLVSTMLILRQKRRR